MQVTQVLLCQPWQAMSSWRLLCAKEHCHAVKGFGASVLEQGNCNAVYGCDVQAYTKFLTI